jgi:hypothetical protein
MAEIVEELSTSAINPIGHYSRPNGLAFLCRQVADALRRHRLKLVGVIGVEPTTSELAIRRSWGLWN